MNFLKAYIEKKKDRNYYKSFYYKNSFYSYDFFSRFNVIQEYNQSFILNSVLKFKGKIDFNSTTLNVINSLGKSRYTSDYENIKNYHILYYKNKINDLKNRSQLHFYNHSFFYGIQQFPYLSSIQKEELLNLLRNKYSIPSQEKLPYKIKDLQNNILFVSDNLNFSLEYITGNETLLKSILTFYNKAIEKKALHIERKKQTLIDIL